MCKNKAVFCELNYEITELEQRSAKSPGRQDHKLPEQKVWIVLPSRSLHTRWSWQGGVRTVNLKPIQWESGWQCPSWKYCLGQWFQKLFGELHFMLRSEFSPPLCWTSRMGGAKGGDGVPGRAGSLGRRSWGKEELERLRTWEKPVLLRRAAQSELQRKAGSHPAASAARAGVGLHLSPVCISAQGHLWVWCWSQCEYYIPSH